MKKFFVLISLLTLSGYACAMEQAKTISKANADAWNAVVSKGDEKLFTGSGVQFAQCQKSADFDINCRYPQEHNKTLLIQLCSMPWGPDRGAILSAILSSHGKNSANPVDANAVDYEKYSALYYAAINANMNYFSLLLQHADVLGLDLNICNDDQWTPLNRLVDTKQHNRVRLLVKLTQVDPNIPNKYKAYPLHSVLRVPYEDYTYGDLDTIRDLKEIGADTEVRNDKGQTPFELCYYKMKTPTFNLSHDRSIALLASGAHIKKQLLDEFLEFLQPDSSFNRCFRHNESIPECEKFLAACFIAALKGTADVKIDLGLKKGGTDFMGMSAELTMAAYGSKDDKEDKALVLNALGAIITSTLSPGTVSPAQRLVVNAQDQVFSMTGLMWAAARGNLPLAKKIIELGANPLLRDAHGDTALHYAVRNGHIDVARYLQKLAPLALIEKNVNKRTPVDVAISSKQSREMLVALAQ